MEAEATGLVLSMVSAVPDPRASNARHRLVDVLAITLLAVIAGADDYPGIVEFGLDRSEMLAGPLALPHGIPSVSTFRRVFAAVDPAAMAEVLGRWSRELVKTCAGKQVALDGPFDLAQGEALRLSFEKAWEKMGMLHLVTAWCVEDALCLGQRAVDEPFDCAQGEPVDAEPVRERRDRRRLPAAGRLHGGHGRRATAGPQPGRAARDGHAGP